METRSNDSKGPNQDGQGCRSEALNLEALIQQASSGDSESFAELYRTFRPRMLGLCRHMLGSREAAEDATSEVFLRLKRAIASYNGSVPFLSWLYSIASHHCVDVIRRRQVEQRFLVDGDTEAQPAAGEPNSPLDEAMMLERNTEVRKAIALLPEKYRLPLVLRYYSDFSYDEIARQLDLQHAHVATLIFRGKQELRQILSHGKGKRMS
ncbi:MAG: RNA polymerase sigma factor [Terriglobia bacterium]